MNNQKNISIIASIIAIVIVAAIGFSVLVSRPGPEPLKNAGQATPGTTAQVATSSLAIVGLQSPTILFVANPFCSARVISTVGKPIMLSFDPNITASSTQGFVQAASTTIAYDSGIYGCSRVQAIGFDSSTSIMTMETR